MEVREGRSEEEGRRREEEGSAIVIDCFGGESWGVVLLDKKVTIELGGTSFD